MYDMTEFLNKTWEIKFIDGNMLHILPPKVKEQYKLNEISETNNKKDYLKNLIKCLAIIINNNIEKINYNEEQLEDLLSENEVLDFFQNYNSWLNKRLDSKN